MATAALPLPAARDVLEAVDALSRVEAGLALHVPSVPLPDGVLAHLRGAADLLLGAARPPATAFAPLFAGWELAVLGGLRALTRAYDRLSPDEQRDYWCAVAAVPQPPTRRLVLPEDAQDDELRHRLRVLLATAEGPAAAALRQAAAPLVGPVLAPVADAEPPVPEAAALAECLLAQRRRLDRALDEAESLRSRAVAHQGVRAAVRRSAPRVPDRFD